MKALARRVGWAVGLGACVTAVVLVARAPGAPPRKPLTDELARSIYVELAQAEPAIRVQGSEELASDPWSRDDYFASVEAGKASELKGRHGVSTQDVFRAIDEGLRRRWPLPEGTEQPRAWVAPLKPRPFD